MIILALESSGLVASVALVTEEKVIGEYTTNFKKTHSQTLLPMMDELLRMTGVAIEQVDAIAVSGGPGSFTGLRIGSATAKGLGLALGKPLISVSTVDSLAYNLCGSDALICPLMDARRSQTYTGLYTFAENTLVTILPPIAIAVPDILDRINRIMEQDGASFRKVIFLGDGAPVFAGMIRDTVTAPWQFAPAHLCMQRAAAVGSLALQYYQEGRGVETAAEHKPEYLRLSQAERELAEKGKAGQ